MRIKRRIFISAPRNNRLENHERGSESIAIKAAIIERVQKLDYGSEHFHDEGSQGGLAEDAGTWTIKGAEDVIRKCIGAVLIGVPFWKSSFEGKEIWLPTEYCQYEGAIAHAFGLPILSVAIGIEPRIMFHERANNILVKNDSIMNPKWIEEEEFSRAFGLWQRKLEKRHDFFLGYSSGAAKTAAKLKNFIEDEFVATVLDWKPDFQETGMIMEEVLKAVSLCTAGIFLFTKDDFIKRADGSEGYIARDNVLLEAGLFIQAKGNSQVLIIKESGVTMPVDLNNKIFAELTDRPHIKSIKERVQGFIDKM